jgi:pyruvate kinase
MKRNFPPKKTKIVCTIGPASQAPEVLGQLMDAGMNVARINFAHGDLVTHREVINAIRQVAAAKQRRVAIMGDLPGPKIRLGEIADGPIDLERDAPFTLVGHDIVGDRTRAAHSFARLPQVVKPGDSIYLNDGYVQLRVDAIQGEDVQCHVEVGGPINSRKGMNLPGIDLGILAFTDEDHDFLRFAAEMKLDAVSQSFVQSEEDIRALRAAAAELDYHPLVIAKIERAGALENLDALLAVVDGIMVARGDLGVEIPVELVPATQKRLIHQANRAGKPVITATHMLESMITNRRPTRAEVTDVANAILDGTDCVMLSGETAVGAFPADAVSVMTRIAAVTEADFPSDERAVGALLAAERARGEIAFEDLVSLNVFLSVETLQPALVFVPTRSGLTAQRLARFRLPVWIVAFSPDEQVCQRLQFTWGVWTVHVPEQPTNWVDHVRAWGKDFKLDGSLAILTEGAGTLRSRGAIRTDILNLES